MALMRPDEDLVDPRFLLYSYLGPEFQEVIRKQTVQGSTVDRVMLTDFPNFPMKLPPLEQQRAIAATLGALDDKIESNRHLAATIWAFLAAEYDRLAVQAPIATLGSVLQLAYGKSLPANVRRPGPVPVLGSNGITGWHDEALIDGPAIVVGRKGSVGEIYWSHDKCWPIDTTFHVQTLDGLPLLAAYFALQQAGLKTMNSDSAIPGLNREAALSVSLPVPIESSREWAASRQELVDLAIQRATRSLPSWY